MLADTIEIGGGLVGLLVLILVICLIVYLIRRL
jgi:hypothetical protein